MLQVWILLYLFMTTISHKLLMIYLSFIISSMAWSIALYSDCLEGMAI